MADLIRQHDWHSTPLGPIGQWPSPLRTTVNMILAHPLPMVLGWGPDFLTLYNDACRPLLGQRPEALGRPFLEVWQEARDTLAPQVDRAWAGETLRFQNTPFTLWRGDRAEKAFFDHSFSPVHDEAGAVAGVLGTAAETTTRLLAQRKVADTATALRASDQRQKFLLALGDAMRAQSTADAMIQAAARLLGKELDASRVMFAEFDEARGTADIFHGWFADGAEPFPAVMDLDDYAGPIVDDLRAGRTVRIDDTGPPYARPDLAAIATLGVKALLSVPLIVDGRLVVNLSVHQHAARRWTDHEVGLVQDVAERLWADLVRVRAEAALRESQRLQSAMLDVIPVGLALVDRDGQVILSNPEWARFAPTRFIPSRDGDRASQWRSWDGTGRPVNPADYPGARALRGESVDPAMEFLYVDDDGRELWTSVASVPVRDADGRVMGAVSIIQDIDAAKRAEVALRESEERQAYLLKLSDALRPLADPGDIVAAASETLGRHLGVGRCGYGETDATDAFLVVEGDWTDGIMPSARGRHRFTDFGAEIMATLLAGQTKVVEDTLPLATKLGVAQAYHAAGGLRASIGVPLMKNGRMVAALFVQQFTPRHWTPNDIALAEETAERTWAALERARTEAALRRSEEKYRSLFEIMDEGFALCELVRDAAGRGVDYRYLEINPALMGHSGISPDALKGRRATEVFPDLDPWLVETYARVVDENRSLLAEHYFPHVDQWLRINAFPRGGDRFAVLFGDVSDRRRAEAALREVEERQRFLLRLSDDLRPLGNAEEIGAAAARALGQQLGANRVAYAENVDDEFFDVLPGHADGLADRSGRYRYADFGADMLSDLRAGHPRVQPDIGKDPRSGPAEKQALAAAGVGASLGVPLVQDGRLVAWLGVDYAAPHDFSPGEIALVSEAAERTWAAVERARAEQMLADELRIMTRLHDLADRLLAIPDLSIGLGEVLDVAVEVLGDCGTIRILDPATNGLRHVAARGFDDTALAALPPVDRDVHSTCARALCTGARVVAADIPADPTWAAHAPTAAALGYSAAISSPMKTRREELLGVLTLHFRNPRVPDEHEQRWADLFARMAAHLVERARSDAALRDSEEALAADLENTERLRGLAERLVTEENVTTIYDEVLSTTVAVAQADAGTVQIYDPRTKSLDLLASRNFSRTVNDYFHRVDAGSRTACGIALKTGQHAFVDFPDEVADAGCRLLVGEGLQSALAVPLVSRSGKPLGMLNAHWRAPRHRPTERQLRFLDLIARQAADLIEQRQAQAVLRESEERLRQFGEASQDVLWIRDAETLQWTYLTPAFETIYGLTRDEALSGNNYRSWLELIVPEDRASATGHMRRARAGQHVIFEYRIRRPCDGQIRWLRNTDFPITDAAGEVRLIGGIGHDITESKLAEQRLEQSEERLRSAVEVGKLGLWDWNIVTGEVHWSDEHFRMEGYGVGEVTPSYDTWTAHLHPDDRAEAEATLHRAMQAHKEYVHEFRVVHPNGSVHWLSGRGRFFYGDDGQPLRMIGAMVETTERREWENRQKVLVAELQHRTRNLMGIVRSMADKTVRASADLQDFRIRFRDRLEALSRVQGLLSRLNDHDRVTFDDLIRTELAAMDGGLDRVTLAGPAGVRLRSSTVQTLAMALHELATNAVKYGALRQPAGHLEITWWLDPVGERGKPWLHIDWRERGVAMPPPGTPPHGTGQGRELIERALPYQLSARTSYDLGPDGVHCKISIPVSASTTEGNVHD